MYYKHSMSVARVVMQRLCLAASKMPTWRYDGGVIDQWCKVYRDVSTLRAVIACVMYNAIGRFYYDFFNDEKKMTDADLKLIKKEMEKIIKQKLPLLREEVTR